MPEFYRLMPPLRGDSLCARAHRLKLGDDVRLVGEDDEDIGLEDVVVR